MRAQRARIDYSDIKDSEMVELVTHVCQCMQNNARFPNPSPAVEAMQSTLKTYEKALQKCIHGTPEETATKNSIKQTLIADLRKWAQYVNLNAEGDLPAIESSGLLLTKKTSSVDILPAPKEPKASDGYNKGEISVEWKKVERSSGYRVEYAEVDTTNSRLDFGVLNTTKTKALLTDLKSMKQYAIRIAATSPKDSVK